jgi:hypothetical protein
MLAASAAFLTQYRSRLEWSRASSARCSCSVGRLVGVGDGADPGVLRRRVAGAGLLRVRSGRDGSRATRWPLAAEPYEASTVDALVAARERSCNGPGAGARRRRRGGARDWADPDVTEERALPRPASVHCGRFRRVAGQIVSDGARPVYASLFAREMN